MVDPVCPYFGSCGGCSSQQVSYPRQLERKKKMLEDLFGLDDIQVISGEPYGYRNRMDFIFHPRGLGLREKGRWSQIVDIEHCAIADERVNNLLLQIRESFNQVDVFHLKKNVGTFRYAVIRVAVDTSISFVLNDDSPRLRQAIEKIKAFSETTTAENVIITRVPSKTDMSISADYFCVKGVDVLHASFMGKTFAYPIQGFFQNNHAMAERMHRYCHDILRDQDLSKTHLLDLYGGVGTFGILNSSLFKSVTIVESVPESISSANENIKTNKISNTKALLLDAKRISKLDLGSPLYVITDPPRSGMHQRTIQRLRELAPERILYISCNPRRLRSELSSLRDFEIKNAALFDFFPQTSHAEIVVELSRRSK